MDTAHSKKAISRGNLNTLHALIFTVNDSSPEGYTSVVIGKTIHHYKIIDRLGKGGMGEVYVAEDTKLKRKIALKVLPEGMAQDPERLDRFQREAEAIAALSHPNIITIFSVEEGEGIHFLTMELVEGKTLDR